MPKATAVFDADDSRLSSALARINGKMLALQSRIAKFAAAFIAVRAVAGVVTAGFDHFRQALDVGGELNDLSANTGVAGGDLVFLQQEFANAGKTAEDIGPVLGKMAKTLQGGSGKSLTYIGTIFNHLLRAGKPVPPGVTAVVVYPLNALVNSQEEELRRFAENYRKARGEDFPIRFAKFTGQEDLVRRKELEADPPHVLLTIGPRPACCAAS